MHHGKLRSEVCRRVHGDPKRAGRSGRHFAIAIKQAKSEIGQVRSDSLEALQGPANPTLFHRRDAAEFEPRELFRCRFRDSHWVDLDGWKAEPYRIIETDKKGRQKDKGWICDLVPKSLIVARYFTKEQAAIDQVSAEITDSAEVNHLSSFIRSSQRGITR